MSRGLWFLTGAGAGVYVVTKARRASEVLTPEGWSDRLSALNLGAQLFAEEYRSARDEKRAELRDRLRLGTGSSAALPAASDVETTPANPKELN